MSSKHPDDTIEDGEIVLVLSTATGGLPHYTAELANALAEKASVTVLKPTDTTADGMFEDSVDVRNAFNSSDLSFVSLQKLDVSIKNVLKSFSSYRKIRTIQSIDPDIIHFTDNLFPPTKAFAAYYDIPEQYPTVVTFHEVYDGPLTMDKQERQLYLNPIIGFGIVAREILNRITPSIDPNRYVVHTEKNRRQLIDKGATANRVKTIPHGTYDIFEKPSDVEPEENTVLLFGKLLPSKAIDTVIEAIAILQESIPDITLIIAGEGNIPDHVKDILKSNPENFKIRNEFIPNEEVGELYAQSQAVLIPHRNQGGHSGTLTIAFDFGKPIIATNTGEFPELVEKTGCGFVVHPESPEDFAKAIKTVLLCDDRRKEMEKQSEAMADRFSWESIAQAHLDMYRDCIHT